jgi:NAD(P)-dependent dehydrogenase (short-subunit alcohol dehydrogenase family)
MSFLAIKGLHVFVTGAAGGIGSAIVDEFLGMSIRFLRGALIILSYLLSQ